MQTSVAPRSHASLRAADDLGYGQEVSFLLPVVAAEGAEAAALDADVGEVDVAVDHVGDQVAHGAATKLVGNHLDSVEFQPRRFEEGYGLLHGDVPALEGVGQGPAHLEIDGANEGFQGAVEMGVQFDALTYLSMPPLTYPFNVGHVQKPRPHGWRCEVVAVHEEFRVYGQAGSQSEAQRLGAPLKLRNLRPGRFRVYVVDGEGRNAAPVVYARGEEERVVVLG